MISLGIQNIKSILTRRGRRAIAIITEVDNTADTEISFLIKGAVTVHQTNFSCNKLEG